MRSEKAETHVRTLHPTNPAPVLAKYFSFDAADEWQMPLRYIIGPTQTISVIRESDRGRQLEDDLTFGKPRFQRLYRVLRDCGVLQPQFAQVAHR
jgi:hypothetical protein